LELDDTLAEAYISLAGIQYFYDWDWPGCRKNIERGLELNPNSPDAHVIYAYYLDLMERHDGSLAEIKRAQELDPLALVIKVDIGIRHYIARRYDQAIEVILSGSRGPSGGKAMAPCCRHNWRGFKHHRRVGFCQGWTSPPCTPSSAQRTRPFSGWKARIRNAKAGFQ